MRAPLGVPSPYSMKIIIGLGLALLFFGGIPSLMYAASWAYKTVESNQAQVKEYAANAEVLASNYYQARSDTAEALEKNRALNREIAMLNKEYARVSAELEALQGAVASVKDLEAQKARLISDIQAFTNVREALVPEIITTQVQCTGSMDPTITCIDTVSLLANPLPKDIGIGTIIAFEPIGTACSVTAELIMHRVIEERGIGKDKQFRTQGDNNLIDDGCWVPMAAVHYYVVGIEKGYNTAAQMLIDRIASLEQVQRARIDRMGASLEEIDRIKAGLALCQPVWGADLCAPVGHVNNLIDYYNRDVREYYESIEVVHGLRYQLQELVFGQ